MRYISTRGGAPAASFSQVLLAGLAPDGGLYVPEEYPQITWSDIEKMRGWSYQRIALFVLSKFINPEDIPAKDLRYIIEHAYSARAFGSFNIVPIQPIADRIAILRLSNGPTLAFKDIALRLVAGLMDYVLKRENKVCNVLGATSGDTGSAAESACIGLEGINVFMLSPYGRMTPFQQKQMYTIHELNIFNLVPDGDFDACQAAVKEVNADAEFKLRYSIGAMNSINWARIAAQTVYWVYGFVQMVYDRADILTAAVPSGNFGNAYSAYVAARMGLRMNIVVCTNQNDVLYRFFETGEYCVEEGKAKASLSPSMDIRSASNLERYIFDLVGRDPVQSRKLWTQAYPHGSFAVTEPSKPVGDTEGFVRLHSERLDEGATKKAMQIAYENYALFAEPHTAIALLGGIDAYGGNGLGPLLIAETARPEKFQGAFYDALKVQLHPFRQNTLFEREEQFTHIEETNPAAIAAAVKSFMKEKLS